jgi:DNA-binding CsgD family transcriptional regulator
MLYEPFVAAMARLRDCGTSDAVWDVFADFLNEAGVAMYGVTKGGTNFASSRDLILRSNLPAKAVDAFVAAGAKGSPLRRRALKTTRSFLMSDVRRQIATEKSRAWFDALDAVAPGGEVLVVPVCNEGQHVGIVVLIGPKDLFSDLTVSLFVVLANAAFGALLPLVPAEPAHRGLTARQARILDLVAQGRTMKEIALQLGISPRTVRFHLDVARSRLGVATRELAVAQAKRLGIAREAAR